MRILASFALPAFLLILLTGCNQQKVIPPIYKWGNYVNSSSDYGMNGHNKEVQEKHIAELRKIISESEAEDRRVAPGIYAELGQILFETGKQGEAKQYLLLEKQTYPESAIFMDRIIAKLYGEAK